MTKYTFLLRSLVAFLPTHPVLFSRRGGYKVPIGFFFEKFKSLNMFVVVERRPRVVERGPRVVERGPRVVERGPRVVERRPRVVERGPRVVERRPRVVERGILQYRTTQFGLRLVSQGSLQNFLSCVCSVCRTE